jgi:hypothetical protein
MIPRFFGVSFPFPAEALERMLLDQQAFESGVVALPSMQNTRLCEATCFIGAEGDSLKVVLAGYPRDSFGYATWAGSREQILVPLRAMNKKVASPFLAITCLRRILDVRNLSPMNYFDNLYSALSALSFPCIDHIMPYRNRVTVVPRGYLRKVARGKDPIYTQESLFD